jgi:hypothetical protein
MPLTGVSMPAWEDDGGSVQIDSPHDDLNSLLAQEQTSIMNAESATSVEAYEYHRDASLHTRQLVNATPYPEHESHVFDQDRAGKLADHEESIRALSEAVEHNERLLALHFANGDLSEKSLHTRGRFLRQDQARLFEASRAAHSDDDSWPLIANWD